MPRRKLPLLLLIMLVLAACGNSRTEVAFISAPASPDGLRTLVFPAAGLRFRVPRSWSVVAERAPLLTVVTSGAATVAVWRFPRGQAVPTTPAALSSARSALLGAVHGRERTLRVIGSALTRLGGVPAIELDAIERIGNSVRRVHSTHLFATGEEVVLDEYAPESGFGSVSRTVFAPVQDSLSLSPGQRVKLAIS